MAQPGRDSITLPSDSTLTGKGVDSWSYQIWDFSPGGGTGALVTRWSQAATPVDTTGNVMVRSVDASQSAVMVADGDVLGALEAIRIRLDELTELLMEVVD